MVCLRNLPPDVQPPTVALSFASLQSRVLRVGTEVSGGFGFKMVYGRISRPFGKDAECGARAEGAAFFIGRSEAFPRFVRADAPPRNSLWLLKGKEGFQVRYPGGRSAWDNAEVRGITICESIIGNYFDEQFGVEQVEIGLRSLVTPF